MQRARRGQSPLRAGGGSAAALGSAAARRDGPWGSGGSGEGELCACFRSVGPRRARSQVWCRLCWSPLGPGAPGAERGRGSPGSGSAALCPHSRPRPSPGFYFPHFPLPFPPIKLYLKCHLNYEIVAENCA